MLTFAISFFEEEELAFRESLTNQTEVTLDGEVRRLMQELGLQREPHHHEDLVDPTMYRQQTGLLILDQIFAMLECN